MFVSRSLLNHLTHTAIADGHHGLYIRPPSRRPRRLLSIFPRPIRSRIAPVEPVPQLFGRRPRSDRQRSARGVAGSAARDKKSVSCSGGDEEGGGRGLQGEEALVQVCFVGGGGGVKGSDDICTGLQRRRSTQISLPADDEPARHVRPRHQTEGARRRQSPRNLSV